MTEKILIDRSVLEQALDALYQATAYTSSESWSPSMTEECLTAATHLCAALEQPQVKQEPVAWAVMQGGAICWEADYPFSNEPGWCDSDQQSVPLYIHPQNLNCKSNQHRLATLWGYVKDQAPTNFEWKEAVIDELVCAIERAHGITGEQE